MYICTCVYSSQSFSLFARLFVLENYNFGRAIAITPAGTSAYVYTYVPVDPIRRAFYLYLARTLGLGTEFSFRSMCVS